MPIKKKSALTTSTGSGTSAAQGQTGYGLVDEASRAAEVEEEEEEEDMVSSTQADLIRQDVEAREESLKGTAYHELGRAKLAGACEWVRERLVEGSWMAPTREQGGCKVVLFAHHIDVLDGVQATVDKALEARRESSKHLEGAPAPEALSFVRIDGSIPPIDRQTLVRRFTEDSKCRVAVIGVTAGGIGT